jgi:hypothetical protein
VDFLADVFPKDNPHCASGTFSCDVCFEKSGTGTSSNNIMSGDPGNTWTSRLQAGRRYRNLHLPYFNGLRSFSKDAISQPTNPWLVTSDEIWDFDIQMYKDIIVRDSATLTIKCKVAMAINGKIIVEKGGRLIIDGGEVTGWCKTGLWKGIEVEGTYGAGQLIYNPTGLAQDFGIVKVINGGTISNAHNGITNARSNNLGDIIWGNQGGIIQCDNANFINNIRDVQFLAYQNPFGNDLSKFTNCNFKIDNLLNAGFGLITRVSLWEVHGVSFLGCKFEYNAGDAYPIGSRGLGIYSIDANYTIDQLCANNSSPCNNVLSQSVFKNFDRGVYVANSNPLKVVSIKNSRFYDVLDRAAFFQNTNYPVFTENYVRTPAISPPAAGLYLSNCKYYNVKNNTIEQNAVGMGGADVGMWIWNSKDGAHKVYRNTFSGLLGGIFPIDNKSGIANSTDGLQMNCNEFSVLPNQVDIALVGTDPTVMNIQGVTVFNQQSSSNLVRNKYGAANCGSENKWFIIGNSLKTIQHGTNSDAVTRPDLPSAACKDPSVNVVPSLHSLDYEFHCLANEIPGCNACPGPGLVAINQALVLASEQAASLANEIPVVNESISHGMQQQVSLAKFNLQAVTAEKIKYFLTDGAPESKDSVIAILAANVGQMKDADIQLVYAYMHKGDYTVALEKTNALASSRADWANLLRKQIAFGTGPKKALAMLDNASGADIAFLSAYAGTDGKDGQIAAQSLLKFLSGNDYYIPRPLPGSSGARTAHTQSNAAETVITANENIVVFPNPTQNGVNVLYNGETEEEVLLEIKDVLGRAIFQTNLSSLSKKYVPLSNLGAGIYLLSITQNKKSIYQSKIIKQD